MYKTPSPLTLSIRHEVEIETQRRIAEGRLAKCRKAIDVDRKRADAAIAARDADALQSATRAMARTKATMREEEIYLDVLATTGDRLRRSERIGGVGRAMTSLHRSVTATRTLYEVEDMAAVIKDLEAGEDANAEFLKSVVKPVAETAESVAADVDAILRLAPDVVAGATKTEIHTRSR